jgi:hypothetical protein
MPVNYVEDIDSETKKLSITVDADALAGSARGLRNKLHLSIQACYWPALKFCIWMIEFNSSSEPKYLPHAPAKRRTQSQITAKQAF